ncbi:hypothetical protein [Microbacterium elymi]|uniref:Uncharacterized protein n=1 Tax=Microbacterium elymi TaxID=2909587 RepID=A0ABY5NLM9_9MICO|nr:MULTISPECIES: hypothetical protein [Microbacterium]UUT36096.1 hypothetical protein L2X98_23780 [Microbacterium elymi]
MERETLAGEALRSDQKIVDPVLRGLPADRALIPTSTPTGVGRHEEGERIDPR